MTLVRRFNIGYGDSGAEQTLAGMVAIVNGAVSDPAFVRFARQLAVHGGVRNTMAQAFAIRGWLSRVWRFVDDPTDTELLRGPDDMLRDYAQHSVIMGDCDEAAIMGAALGTAVGIPSRLVALAFTQANGKSGPFEHVYAALVMSDGSELDLDVTRPNGMTILPAIARTLTADVNATPHFTLGDIMPGALGPGRVARTPAQRVGYGDILTDTLTIGGAAATGGTSAVVGTVAVKLYTAFTGGAAVDQQRQARVNYFLQQAEQGNVAAAQLILGAPPNVSGNERTMWVGAANILQSNPEWRQTLQEAQQEGPVWLTGSGDTATNYPAMRQFTAAWAARNQPSIGQSAAAAGSAAVAVAQKAPVALWVGLAAVAYYVLASRRRG